MTQNNVDGILQEFLRVLAGASQIAIDRNADSGMIDFTETIQKTKRQLYDLIMKEISSGENCPLIRKAKRLKCDECSREAYCKCKAINFAIHQTRDAIKRVFGEGKQ